MTSILKYHMVEVGPMRWESRPLSLWKSLEIHFHDFLFERFPKFHLKYWPREHTELVLTGILATELQKEINSELLEAITKEANITQEQANKAVSDYLDRIG